mmetsp:Transcript_11872/g.35999  ORF Transcript_11872/g.35999 Transcript_11872/m.35999 type:complete len:260 (-) Transcript_11872:1720-2499(-)
MPGHPRALPLIILSCANHSAASANKPGAQPNHPRSRHASTFLKTLYKHQLTRRGEDRSSVRDAPLHHRGSLNCGRCREDALAPERCSFMRISMPSGGKILFRISVRSALPTFFIHRGCAAEVTCRRTRYPGGNLHAVAPMSTSTRKIVDASTASWPCSFASLRTSTRATPSQMFREMPQGDTQQSRATTSKDVVESLETYAMKLTLPTTSMASVMASEVKISRSRPRPARRSIQNWLCLPAFHMLNDGPPAEGMGAAER